MTSSHVPDGESKYCPVCGQGFTPSISDNVTCRFCGSLLWFDDTNVTKIRFSRSTIMTVLAHFATESQYSEPHYLLIDFTDVEILSTTEMSLLIRASTSSPRLKNRILIHNVNPAIREVLHVTKLDQLFRFAN